MNKATWESISKEGRTVWDTLSDGDKRKILQYAHGRTERTGLQANQHDSVPASDNIPSDHPPRQLCRINTRPSLGK